MLGCEQGVRRFTPKQISSFLGPHCRQTRQNYSTENAVKIYRNWPKFVVFFLLWLELVVGSGPCPHITIPITTIASTSPLEGGSVNRCFQVGKASRKARCGKIGRRRRPIISPRPRLVEICRNRAAIFPQPSFRDSPFSVQRPGIRDYNRCFKTPIYRAPLYFHRALG